MYFDPNNMTFNLRDLGKGLGIFYKITTEVILKDKSVINLDNCFIFVSIDETNDLLTLKVFTENGNQTYDPM